MKMSGTEQALAAGRGLGYNDNEFKAPSGSRRPLFREFLKQQTRRFKWTANPRRLSESFTPLT